MVKKKINVLECDLCSREDEPNSKGKYPEGWLEINIKALTYDRRGVPQRFDAMCCPECSGYILKAINRRDTT